MHEMKLEIIRLLGEEGLSNREIAKRLHRSEKTIKFHLTEIYKRLKLRNRVELINMYHGLELKEWRSWKPKRARQPKRPTATRNASSLMKTELETPLILPRSKIY